MTLDEAIKHCEEVMMDNVEKTKDRNASDPVAHNCFECADNHRQLAEWLKELKRYKEYGPCAFCKHNTFEESAPCFHCPAGMSFAENVRVKVVEE